MSYKFLNASMPINYTPKEGYVGYFQETLNRQFENSSDVWTIREETFMGSKEYRDVIVRVMNHILKGDTGIKVADDFKKILFKDITHATGIGFLYYFNNNYWLTINADIIKNLAASAVVKRCNNVMRWLDSDGGYHQSPCVIDYVVKNNRDYSTVGSSMILPAGEISIMAQFNDDTRTIKPNQRFLFGSPDNWFAYKVLGGGMNNFDNKETENNESQGLIRISATFTFINEQTDDIVNGIADVGDNIYTVNLSQTSIQGNVGQKIQLYSTVTFNGKNVSRNLTWSTDNDLIATVDSYGVVTFVSTGYCNITCNLEDRVNVFDTCVAETIISPVTDYEIVLTPNRNYVNESVVQNFNVELYLNNILQPDTFVFTLIPNSVPYGNYLFTSIDGNNFTIENKKLYVDSHLIVRCVSGIHTKDIDVYLKGTW